MYLALARTAAMTVALDWLFSTNERSYQLLFLGAVVSVVLLVHHVGETRKVRLLSPPCVRGLIPIAAEAHPYHGIRLPDFILSWRLPLFHQLEDPC